MPRRFPPAARQHPHPLASISLAAATPESAPYSQRSLPRRALLQLARIQPSRSRPPVFALQLRLARSALSLETAAALPLPLHVSLVRSAPLRAPAAPPPRAISQPQSPFPLPALNVHSRRPASPLEPAIHTRATRMDLPRLLFPETLSPPSSFLALAAPRRAQPAKWRALGTPSLPFPSNSSLPPCLRLATPAPQAGSSRLDWSARAFARSIDVFLPHPYDLRVALPILCSTLFALSAQEAAACFPPALPKDLPPHVEKKKHFAGRFSALTRRFLLL